MELARDSPLIRARYDLGEAAAAELARQVTQHLCGG